MLHAADVVDKFFSGQTLMANPLNSFGAFVTTMTLQRLSIQSVTPYATIVPFDHNLNGEFWDLHQSKAHPRLLYLPPFGCNSIVKLRLPNSTGSKMVPIETSSQHSYSTHTHIIGISCTVWPQYTTRQIHRQTDRNRPPML